MKPSFSILLARRYLNPKRAALSSFTLISLIGVILGVLVLVVVMAVYAGLERDVKSRLLGYTPHILMQEYISQQGTTPMTDWQDQLIEAKKIPHVIDAAPYLSDHAIMDIASFQRPVFFQAIDGENAQQQENLKMMLDLAHHPSSSADLGLDDRIILSSQIAEQLGIQVGDKIKLYSTRNFDPVLSVYRSTENPPLRERFPQAWKKLSATLNAAWKADKTAEWALDALMLREQYDQLVAWYGMDIREPEKDLLFTIIQTLESAEKSVEGDRYLFSEEQKKRVGSTLEALHHTDVEKMDADVLKHVKQLVLPKEAEVIGIYLSSQMAVTPDFFASLPLAQDLSGNTNTVQGISLRLEDPYSAEEVALKAREHFKGAKNFTTWGDQYQQFFLLINQQRVMMYFALSFIVLVSAFSMMAVMFTVTIQKKREIGIMKALGASSQQIISVFLYQGILLGFLGAAIGIGLAHIVLYFRGEIQSVLRQIGFDPFSASLTGFHVLPIHHNPLEQFWIGVMALLLCSLAALIPAFFAARSDAGKSLRNL